MPKIIATVLMLLKVFNCVQPLILFLLKGQDSLCISQAQSVVHLTLLNLKNGFTREEFHKINLQASEQVLLLPISTNLRHEPFKY